MTQSKTKGKQRVLLYKEAYCDDIVEYLAKGHTITQWAARVGVLRCTVSDWVKRFPEFADAYHLAVQASEATWHGRLEDMMYSRDVNSGLVKMYFANRFGWRDKHDVDQTSSDGSMSQPKQIVIAGMPASGLSNADEDGEDGEDGAEAQLDGRGAEETDVPSTASAPGQGANEHD